LLLQQLLRLADGKNKRTLTELAWKERYAAKAELSNLGFAVEVATIPQQKVAAATTATS
jgi:hypothetical protein